MTNETKISLINDSIDKEDLWDLACWLVTNPRLTKGELTLKFEQEFARFIGTKFSVFCNSGSSAILLALSVIKEEYKLKNNKIVVPSLSWITDVSIPINLGFDVILCDCNLEDLSVDLENLEKIFQQENPSVFILVSVLGLIPKIEEIKNLCQKYEVLFIEDNCESLGSKYNDQNLGTFGLMSLFSTYYGHLISTIEGRVCLHQ